MAKKASFWLALGLMTVVFAGIAGAQNYTINDVMKEVVGLKVEVAGMKGEFKSALAYLDWKINLIILIVLSILGFVFVLAREIGFGTRDKIEKIKAYLEQVSEKIHLPKPIL